MTSYASAAMCYERLVERKHTPHDITVLLQYLFERTSCAGAPPPPSQPEYVSPFGDPNVPLPSPFGGADPPDNISALA